MIENRIFQRYHFFTKSLTRWFQGKISIQLKARTALEEILELYSQKPELGSADAMEDSRSQIDEITQTLDKLQEELYKYQVRFT